MESPDEIVKRYAPLIRNAYQEQEQYRNYAFLGIPYVVAGVSILPLTLRKMLFLESVGNPFVCGGKANSEDSIQFLWCCSDKYSGSLDGFEDFRSQIDLQNVVSETAEFVDAMFLDQLPCGESKCAPAASFTASMIHVFAKNYGWQIDSILDSPLPVLHQLLKLISRDNGNKIAFNLKADRLKSQMLRELNVL